MTTLYQRIETLSRLDAARNKPDVPMEKHRQASGAIADNALLIIGELTERMEKAHQLFQDLDELPYVPFDIINEGMDLTDIVQNYPLKKSKS